MGMTKKNNKRINKGVSINPIALVLAQNFELGVRYFNQQLHIIGENGKDKLTDEQREMAYALAKAQHEANVSCADAFLTLLAKK